jgi:hypothetical protein
LTFTQCADRPDLYGEPSSFDAMPSQPSAQACSNTISPSPSKCSLSTMSGSWSAEGLRQRLLAVFDRRAAQVAAVEFDQIEGAQHGCRAMRRRINSNTASPTSLHTIASPSITQERTRGCATAIAIKGKRAVKVVARCRSAETYSVIRYSCQLDCTDVRSSQTG